MPDTIRNPNAVQHGEELLTVREVMAALRLGERSVYRLLARGDLPGIKIGSTWRIRRRDLDHLLTPDDA